MNITYKISYYWSIFRFVVFFIIGILLAFISIFVFLFSVYIGLFVLVAGIVFLALSWMNKKAADFNKKSGKNAVEKLKDF